MVSTMVSKPSDAVSVQPECSTLGSLLEPLSEEEFLEKYWNRRWTHIRGTKGRFETLLPWEVLNDLLVRHRLDEPRLRLFRDGQRIPTSCFISYEPRRTDPSAKIPKLLPEKLTAHLRNGATLVLDNVDELYSPITDLVEGLERRLRLRASANVYAGWHTSHGFNLHWDDHDEFIVQVFGRKRWQIYGVTREHPLGLEGEPNGEWPTKPIWDGILESGDVLYIPRGVWHVAFPLDEPTLHLTFGFATSTGMDLLDWLAGELCENATFRADLPRLGTEQEKAEHLSALRLALEKVWASFTLDDYLEYCDYMARPRPRLSLPFTPLKVPLSISDNLMVRWNATRDIAPVVSNGTTMLLRANGKQFEFAPQAMEIIDCLRDRMGHSISDLCAKCANSVSNTQLIAFLNALVEEGLLTIESRHT
jgi:ribosomal protein L16 Arg81 hydroxylase